MITDPRPELRAFLGRFFSTSSLEDSEDMFQAGYVNSMFAMELVRFVERQFGITVESDDLELDNFRSVDALSAFVERKRCSA